MGPWGILSVGVVVVVADQVTKSLAARRLTRRSGQGGVLSLSINRRLPLTSYSSAPMLAVIWLGAVSCAALALTVSPALRADPVAVAGMTAAIAGATSNLVDWLRAGAIVDFISLGWWPAFNLADAAIVTGGGLAVLSLFI